LSCACNPTGGPAYAPCQPVEQGFVLRALHHLLQTTHNCQDHHDQQHQA
jgi:hypothetical protein